MANLFNKFKGGLSAFQNALLGAPVEVQEPETITKVVYPENITNFVNNLPNQDYAKPLYNKPAQLALSQDEILRGVANGKNFGVQQIADWQKQNNIRIPQTSEDRYLADMGQFNQYPVSIESGTVNPQRQGGFFRNFAEGYKDNYNNGMNINQWGEKRGAGTRVGEFFGSLGRFIDSPWGRMAIAGGLIGALGGSPAQMLGYGVNAGVGRQKAKTADSLYRQQLENQGIDVSGITGNVDKDMFKNITDNVYKQQRLQVQQAIANAKDNTSRAKLILDSLNNGTMTPQEAQIQIAQYGITATELQKSNQTRQTEVKEYLAPHQANFYDNNSAASVTNANSNAVRANAYAAGVWDNINNPKPTAAEMKDQRQLQQASKTVNTIKQAYKAILDNPKAFGYLKGVMGADITNRLDTKGTKQRAIVEGVAAEYRKYLTGAQMSDKEREAYYKFIPSPNDNAKIAKRKLEGMLTVIASREGVKIPDLSKMEVTGQVVKTNYAKNKPSVDKDAIEAEMKRRGLKGNG